MLNDHIKGYQKYFNRVYFDIGQTDETQLPNNVRLSEFKEGKDFQLVSLYFQFGRYLQISSSQPGGQAANLQGLWNPHTGPPWGSKRSIVDTLKGKRKRKIKPNTFQKYILYSVMIQVLKIPIGII
ncbi:MAG: hypothetical protein H7334_13645 [Ferruginibacter sp.]|nr:hypothetical protein [Ferruginibacter sp.]